MTKEDKKSSYYETDSLYEAAYLQAQGFSLLGIENSASPYKKIIFEDSQDLKEALVVFYQNGQVPVLSFVNSYKRLKSEVFSKRTFKNEF